MRNTDRYGKLQLPFEEALELAQKFSAKEPQSALTRFEATEREWSRDARTPGGEYIVPLLNEYRAAWALIRQWTGHDPAGAAEGSRDPETRTPSRSKAGQGCFSLRWRRRLRTYAPPGLEG
jgi:hypothetical protein